MNSYLQYAQVPLSNANEPFRIIFIMDGSGSMGSQYPTMLAVYKKLFSGMNNVEAFQFSSRIGPLEPFFGGGTDIQIAMENLTQILERGVPQTNVCAVFVSDGEGSENAQTLAQRYVALQRKYQIIFISVAVGSGFPTLLSNKLRNMIHNGTSTVPAILPVDRNEQFEPQFTKVLQYANQQKLIQIQNQVLRQPWNPPTNMVYPGEVVAVNDKEEILKTTDGKTFVPNLTAPLTQAFVYGQLQLIIQLVANQHPNQNQYLDQMINYVYDVRKVMEDQGAIHKIALYVDLGKVITLLEDIKSKKIDILKIGDQKLKEIMLENNPDKNQNTDSKLSQTSQVLYQQAQANRLDVKYIENVFTVENKMKLLEKRRLNERFQLFMQLCAGNQQITNYMTQNQPYALQLVDSQLLFLK